MKLLINAIQNELENLNKNNVRLSTIGETKDLPKTVQKKLDEAKARLANNSGLNLVIALSYSGRWEIADAVKQIAEKVKDGDLDVDAIDADTIQTHLNTSNIPDPELLIRTSGERRISNFLLWQLAYTELYFSPVLWPDFRKEHFFEAMIDFQRRDRRFGGVTEQDRAQTVNN